MKVTKNTKLKEIIEQDMLVTDGQETVKIVSGIGLKVYTSARQFLADQKFNREMEMI